MQPGQLLHSIASCWVIFIQSGICRSRVAHLCPLKLRAGGCLSGANPLAAGLSCVPLQRVQFGMYALYSKNKPRSDALMSNYGHTFFKVRGAWDHRKSRPWVADSKPLLSPHSRQERQQALGDHLDLASYLLKPIHRMSKYALLLQELARACGGPAQELSALEAAQSLVHFQLRHGKDLLAMDAIQGCDVSQRRPCGDAPGSRRGWDSWTCEAFTFAG